MTNKGASGWVKLHRNILDWEWYSDHNTSRVFIHLLLTANIEPKRWHGVEVGIGQRVFGIYELAREVGITPQSLRTSLTKLKSTSEVTIKSTNRFSLLSIVKWAEYQGLVTSKSTSHATNNQQTTNKQLTTTKEVKNIRIKEDKNIYIEIISHFNQTFGKQTKSYATWQGNCDFHLKSYTLEDIKTAITNCKKYGWWAEDPSLELFFRTKNKAGQPVDYIDQLLNSKGARREKGNDDPLVRASRKALGYDN